MKRAPSWIKFYGIGGGSSGAPIPGGNVARADKLPKA